MAMMIHQAFLKLKEYSTTSVVDHFALGSASYSDFSVNEILLTKLRFSRRAPIEAVLSLTPSLATFPFDWTGAPKGFDIGAFYCAV